MVPVSLIKNCKYLFIHKNVLFRWAVWAPPLDPPLLIFGVNINYIKYILTRTKHSKKNKLIFTIYNFYSTHLRDNFIYRN